MGALAEAAWLRSIVESMVILIDIDNFSFTVENVERNRVVTRLVCENETAPGRSDREQPGSDAPAADDPAAEDPHTGRAANGCPGNTRHHGLLPGL